jgi:LPXTG-motif cell wall-anchored protein
MTIMKNRVLTGLCLGVAALATAVAAPGAASAAPPAADPHPLFAVAERDEATGRNVSYPVKQGELVPAVLGVANPHPTPVAGAYLNVRVLNDLDFSKKFDNCLYYVDSNLDGAWCKFDEELAVDGTYVPSDFFVSTAPNAAADKVQAIIFRWYSGAYGDAAGGLQGLVDRERPLDGPATPGTDGTLRLKAQALTLHPDPAERRNINFAYPKLIVPATPSPTVGTPSPTAVPTAIPTAAPTTDAPAPGGEGGGLPVTGTQTATLAGVGGAVVLLGAVGYVVARRRRTRFVA